jgi:hypothetical protein
MCKQDNRGPDKLRNTIEAVTIASTTTDAAVGEILRKITGVEKIQHAIAAEYVLAEESRLATYSAGSVEETCQVLTYALNTGAEVLGLLGIDATGTFFMATFGIGGLANERATQDVLSFKDEFLTRHKALLQDPSEGIEKGAKHED